MMKKTMIIAFNLLVLALLLTSVSGCTSKIDARNITMAVDGSDVSLFYDAVEAAEIAGADNDALSMGRYLYKHYVQKGSLGLKNYFMRRFAEGSDEPDQGALQRYGKRMNGMMPFLKANRKSIEGHVVDTTVADEIVQNMYAFLGDDYLDALSGKQVNVIIGAGNMGGGAFREGVFIDAGIVWSADMDYKGSPLEHVSSALPKFGESLNFLLAHEMIHALQINTLSDEALNNMYSSSNRSMVELAIAEGGASFLASLVVGNRAYRAFARSRVEYIEGYGKEKLLNEFLNDASEHADASNVPAPDKDDVELKWFYNFDVDMGDRPPDLGYSMGYLITKAYWDNNVGVLGESETFSNIIKAATGDASSFLEQAGLSAN